MPQFTAKQQQAIDDRDRDILVSASAGSGKTTVLVERVMQEILAGTGVDQLLVVTFTKAAAQEMKTRIKQVLEERLKEGSDKRYLRQQLNQVDTANISTIDAFCLDIIHRFYYVIDIDPSFSVLTDETQAALLRERALREIEGEFLEAKDADFIAFYDNFAGDRDAASAQGLLLDLYDFAMAKPDYRDWLKQLSQKYQVTGKIVTSDLWQQQIKPYLTKVFTSLNDKIADLLASSQIETKELSKVKESFTIFARCLQNYRQGLATDVDYEQQRELLRSCIFTGSYRQSNKWDEDLLAVYQESKVLKKEAKDQIFAAFTSFYATDEAEQLALLKQGQQIMTAITKAELALIDRFNQLKRAENLIDYSDMEQLAYQILSQDTSNSQLAREFYRRKFKEILVDEYQDINALQEKILQLLKEDKQNNLFMVGDVKQSIYGFRQAEPSLFLHKYHEAAKSENDDQERILLSANFRSTKPVVKLVNQIFNSVLSTDFGGIDYQKEGQLIFGADYYPAELPAASELLYHEKATPQKQDTETKLEFDSAEIAMVINRIQQLKQEHFEVYDQQKKTHKRPFKYSDIAILTRSRSDNLLIMQEFAKSNIPLFITDAKNYFQTLELTIMMNYLKLIDNPDQDIPLVTVLRSPLFNFKEPDLAKIRIHSKNTSFFNALTSYVTMNDQLSERVKTFLNQLDNLRQFAMNHRISELIWSVYEQTNLLEIMTALPNGEQRRVNLEALYERASSYESAGFKGLYQFINFIERMRRSQKDLAQPLLTKEAGDAVRLMTVHGSKGLEFPIVFYIGLQHRFQMRDLSGNYLINNDNVGLTLRRKHYRADSLIKAIDNIHQRQKLLEEEARILYVGLTRAKQKLILVADIPNLAKNKLAWAQQLNHQGQLTLTDKLAATSPLSFIGPIIHFDEQISQTIATVTKELDQSQDFLLLKYSQEKIAAGASQEVTTKKPTLPLLDTTVRKLYDFTYPFKDASQTTAYQAVSEIKKAFNDPLDTDLENAHLLASTNRYLQPIDTKPDFLFASKFTGAEIGTATHLILQYYNYRGQGNSAQLEAEIQELVKQKKLNPKIVASLKKDEIEWFVHSDFARDFWQRPANLKREVDFSSLLAASTLFADFSDPDAKILVHGTIDGYFETPKGIILFDYKTDHVDKNNLVQAIAKIKQKYTGQLRLYEQALNSFAKQKVIHKYLILLDAKRAVEVK
ncbi:helicase-exonuclease AddAB subunit AddA [Lactobacillus sp. ESL0785]|uniref:helicase-exonuclease AddAB subunit AddA n=1 Tax=Lactobacillus sp. ESL0785 TaxID=2983232 RepID=UPI0023F6FA04|nr:helicase-exonuclease AddAB subunit AddA [Lactobacillus sp. ESL0785]WEV70178.1 helicase-exonuclease AddAB subunit AddA [Lactobacillus sp. ESL0785]